MADPWDEFLVVEDAAIKLIDRDLIDKVVKLTAEERRGPDGYIKLKEWLRIYYVDDMAPHQPINVVCVC